MKEYLLLFWNESGQGQYLHSPDKLKANMAAWQNWIGKIAQGGNLISTKPINWAGVTVSNAGTKTEPSIKENQMVTGYLICKATGIEQVQDWAKTCPILTNKAGYTEIREVSPFEL